MSLSYLVGSGVGEKPGGRELYDEYASMRDWLEQVRCWTGVTPEQILIEEIEGESRDARVVPRVRSAALAIGVHDVLAELGVRPASLGGVSLGGLVSAVLAGAVDRRTFLELLVRLGEAPRPYAGIRQGMATVYAPVTEDPAAYVSDGVGPACDMGLSADGSHRVQLVSGRRDALDALAAERPPGEVTVTGHIEAFHSELQRPVAEFMTRHYAAATFRAPELPVFSCFEEMTLRTPDEVRDAFARNVTDPVSLPYVTAAMLRHGVTLAVVPGPSLPPGVLRYPFPVVHVETPDDIATVMTTIYELGVEIPPMRHGAAR